MLQKIFEQNPNVRTFATNASTLNSNWTKAANLKLDVLAMYVRAFMSGIFTVTEQLSKMGFYNRLHLYLNGHLSIQLNQIEKLVFHDAFISICGYGFLGK